jgi:hypothetical protein
MPKRCLTFGIHQVPDDGCIGVDNDPEKLLNALRQAIKRPGYYLRPIHDQIPVLQDGSGELPNAARLRITILVVVQNLYRRENTPPKWTQQLSSLNWNLNETVSTVPLQPFREAGAAMLERRLVSPMAGKDISRPQREGRLGKP